MSYLSNAQSFANTAQSYGNTAQSFGLDGSAAAAAPTSSSMSYLTHPAVFYIILASILSIVYCFQETMKGKMDSWSTRSIVSGWVIISLVAMSIIFGSWESIKMGDEAPPVIAAFFIAYCVTLSVSSCCVYCA